jgi:hypothetical protein
MAKKSKGLGDVVDAITTKTGIKKAVHKLFGDDCGCDERKQKLNELFPIRWNASRCFTEAEFNWYDNFVNTRTLTLSKEQQKQLITMHESIFMYKYRNICSSCSGGAKILMSMIKRLDKIYESYGL